MCSSDLAHHKSKLIGIHVYVGIVKIPEAHRNSLTRKQLPPNLVPSSPKLAKLASSSEFKSYRNRIKPKKRSRLSSTAGGAMDK